MYPLILRKLGAVAFVPQLTQPTSRISSCVLGLVQGIQRILSLECIPGQWSHGCIVKLGSVNLVLVAVVIAATECIHGRPTSFISVANEVL